MRKRQVYYYSNMTPFAALGLALLALGAFFLTLPILIAAFVVFGAIGSYVAWRITRALKRAEEEMIRRQQQMGTSVFDDNTHELIIDITPEVEEEKRSIENERF